MLKPFHPAKSSHPKTKPSYTITVQPKEVPDPASCPPSPFEILLEKANLFLDLVPVDFGDPELSEIRYFQSKKSSVFSTTNSPLQPPNSNKSGTNQSNSELFKNRPGMKSLPLIKSLVFSSPQPIKRTIKKPLAKKPSIEDFSELSNDSSLISLELSDCEGGRTETSANLDSRNSQSLRKMSIFSTLFTKETFDELESGKKQRTLAGLEQC